MIYWTGLERLVDCLDQIWYGSESGKRLSRELHAISELGRCNQAAAPALCFFAGRMVEGFVSDEWDRYQAVNGFSHLNQRHNLDEQINHLQQLGLLSALSAACIHEVRKLGNRVRHGPTFPSMTQAAFCLAMIKVNLPCMAGAYREAVRAACYAHHVTVMDQEVTWLLGEGTLTDRSVGFSDLLHTAPNLLYTLNRREPSFPTEVTNWVTQQCINADRLDLAGELISRFIENGDPDAPQLRADRDGHFRVSHFNRLIALRLSRMGRSGAAIDLLTDLAIRARYLAENGAPVPLQSTNSHSYAETLGILAGAYKTRWMKQRGTADLAYMARLYQYALKAEPWNTYLAINAAACTAWSGDMTSARALCAKLLKRFEPIPLNPERQDSQNLWNMLTLAEALLIGGQHIRALECYGQANEIFGSSHAGDIKRALTQTDTHAQHKVIDGSLSAQIAKVFA